MHQIESTPKSHQSITTLYDAYFLLLGDLLLLLLGMLSNGGTRQQLSSASSDAVCPQRGQGVQRSSSWSDFASEFRKQKQQRYYCNKVNIMGATCCGAGVRQSKRRRGRSRMVHSATTEPLLRESEREAVSNLLRYLEEG